MKKLFTAVMRVRIGARIVAEMQLLNGDDRLEVEKFIERAATDVSVNDAGDFLKKFYGKECITTVEMKFD